MCVLELKDARLLSPCSFPLFNLMFFGIKISLPSSTWFYAQHALTVEKRPLAHIEGMVMEMPIHGIRWHSYVGSYTRSLLGKDSSREGRYHWRTMHEDREEMIGIMKH
nr:uncharacterized protein LOC130541032 [Pan paniscus]